VQELLAIRSSDKKMTEALPRDAGRSRDAKAVAAHRRYGGKVQVMPKCPLRDSADFALWYTPGVAAPCRAIEADPEEVYALTNKANSIAVVSDGSRVLGLGNIGPEAGLPVMEGKALLFKYLGGVDAVPLCLATQEAEKLIEAVDLLQPSFGAINLEDIAQPRCFRVLDALRQRLTIPVWHDDQQGTAAAALAGLTNALKVVGKEMRRLRIVMFGMGAANVATYRLLTMTGTDPRAIVAIDSRGILHRGRGDIEAEQESFYDKWEICRRSNGEALAGEPAQAFRGADVCIAFSQSGPGIIPPAWIATMAKDAIVFACANPVPEIWPEEAHAAGARIVATGRSDFPNQLNNSLIFPGVFRGTLDVRAAAISDRMAEAAARALAAQAEAKGLRDDYILPTMGEWQVAAEIAAATGEAAEQQGLARTALGRDALYEMALARIGEARDATHRLLSS
jgi:malate dehydrogenase (oxaloacetate-decarboxylating)